MTDTGAVETKNDDTSSRVKQDLEGKFLIATATNTINLCSLKTSMLPRISFYHFSVNF